CRAATRGEARANRVRAGARALVALTEEMADVGTLEREELLRMNAPTVIEVRGNRAVGLVAGHRFRKLERFEGLVHGVSPARSVGDRSRTGFVRRHLRHERRELADEPGF